MIKVMWLTLADPEPANNGQFLYSGGLIRAVAAADPQIELHVVGLRRPDQMAMRKTPFEANVIWHLTDDAPRSRWASRLSLWPQLAMRTKTKAMETALGLLLREQWDAIVFDSISVGWALPGIKRHWRGQAVLVYLAHNFETGIAMLLAGDEANFVRRAAKIVDAWKVLWLERAICRHAAVITANTPKTRKSFSTPGQRTESNSCPRVIRATGLKHVASPKRLLGAL